MQEVEESSEEEDVDLVGAAQSNNPWLQQNVSGKADLFMKPFPLYLTYSPFILVFHFFISIHRLAVVLLSKSIGIECIQIAP